MRRHFPFELARHARAIAVTVMLPLFACSIAKIPEQQPSRVLDLERRLPVVVVSNPPGIEVYAAGPAGERGDRLGLTPVTIDVLVLQKEIWKHGQLLPPAPAASVLLERREDTGTAAPRTRVEGERLTWTLWVSHGPESQPHRVAPSLPIEALEQAFSRGRVELNVAVPGAGSTAR